MARRLAELGRRAWTAYETQLTTRPVRTQMASSTVLWGVGDVLAQTVGESETLATLDWRRVGITSLFGTCFVGPVGHFWYIYLDRACLRLAPLGSTRFLAYKVGLDTSVLGPTYIAAFLGWGCAFIDGGGLKEYGEKLQSDFPSLLAASLAVWPLFQLGNFRLVPLRHQLLAVNGMTLLDASFLAWARGQEDWLATLLRPFQQAPRLQLPKPLVEAICGAVGEVSQICVLYPLETIKVKCQTEGLNAGRVVSGMLASSNPLQVYSKLYAGFASAALLSVAVGAIHYMSFCWSKRVALAAAGIAPAGDADHHGGGAAASGANAVAALFGALCTALVEAPVELFRHRAQAGLCDANFLAAMGTSAVRSGPLSLYSGFWSYCFEAFPYDITELGTYAQLRDTYEAAARPGATGVGASVVRLLQPSVWDMVIGGSAGAAAVLVSMPFDCVKTYIQCNSSTHAGSKGLLTEAAVFCRTAAMLVRTRGAGALFVGVVPRLVQQVPSSTICWWAIEVCRRTLQPVTAQA